MGSWGMLYPIPIPIPILGYPPLDWAIRRYLPSDEMLRKWVNENWDQWEETEPVWWGKKRWRQAMPPGTLPVGAGIHKTTSDLRGALRKLLSKRIPSVGKKLLVEVIDWSENQKNPVQILNYKNMLKMKVKFPT